MILAPHRQRRLLFLGLLFLFGAQLVFGTIQDGQVLASPHEPGPPHDRPYADAGRSVDLMDEAQEEDESLAGPDHRDRPPLPNAAGPRLFPSIMSGQLELVSGPFRPPRLSQ